ncbi:hypothetical protein [Mesobacillus jeotgali]|uniref:hypothetical protein n=1 Tax=Mesobacillus jeotgali TaxID=129985 RepID=UPI001CFE7028|nr:hypothetical protein [Mesobacillus jeotgali]
MSKKLTSGPFFVPLSVDGSPVQFLLIGFKNLADHTSTVRLTVHNCRDTLLYPATPPEIEIYREKVRIPAGDCAVIRIDAGQTTFSGNNMLRVAIKGDTDEDADDIVIALSGNTADGRQALSMVFKHEEFVEMND